MSDRIIEQELLRKRLYTELVDWLVKTSSISSRHKVAHMVLRYRFNQRQYEGDDPIFIVDGDTDTAALKQLRKDLTNFEVPVDLHDQILAEFIAMIAKAANTVMTTSLPKGQRVTLKDGRLIYGTYSYKDVMGLGKIDPVKAFALQLRYEYIDLSNHGLARMYSGDKSKQAEGFASAFNHYYDEYCSVFPDLEDAFGSQGTFFDVDKFASEIVQVNPPFDETVMEQAMERVYKLLADGATNTFVFTIPKWDNYEPLLKLENSKWTVTIVDYEKGQLEFIDHMTGKVIAPCGITEVTLRN